MAKFEIFKGSDGQFYFHLRATGNNEIVLRGEGYRTKAACEAGINSVKLNAPLESRYQRRQSAAYQYSFHLKAGNGEIIGYGETYTSASARDHGIEVVKAQAPTAPVVDLTPTS